MARALEVRPKTYDEAKLASMVAPFTVRIEKIKGNTRSPIPLPETEDGAPAGTGWGIEEVRQLEQWLVTEWAGGGIYEISLTDSSQQPQTMKWQPVWDTKIYPEKVPPPLVDAATGAGAPQQLPMSGPASVIQMPLPPQHHQQGRSMPPVFPNGLPQGLVYPQQQPTYAQPYYQPAPMPNPPMPGTMQWDAWQREAERREQQNRDRERETEIRKLQLEREKTEREAITAKHAAELERERQANEARFQAQANQMTELRAMLTSLTVAIKDNATAARPNAEVEAMREQIRQNEAKLERERAEREAERRDAAMRDMIKQMQEQMRLQMEMAQRQSEERMRALEAASRDSKPDQLLMMMQQMQREQIEASKEQGRNFVAQMTAMQQYMMNPRDMMAMAKESTSQIDQATERVTRFFGSVIDTQQKVTENLLQMQPGGNGVVDLVGTGMERIGTLAERYIQGKQLDAQLAHQGQVQIAEAQARAYAVAVAAQTAQQAQPEPQPQLQTSGAGLGNPAPQPKPKKAKAQTAPAINVNGQVKRLGKTDQEWFGVLMSQVQDLRTNANKFIESLKANPETDKPEGLSPEQAAQVILQAVQIVVQRQVAIPVMQELLFQDRFADFVDVLLPNPIVTQPYRDDLVQLIIRAARVSQGMPPDGETHDHSVVLQADDDEDEDADDADDDGDDDGDEDSGHEDLIDPPAEKPVQLAVVKPTKNGQPARRT